LIPKKLKKALAMLTIQKQKKMNIPFLKPKIDSLRLIIPFDLVNVNPNHSTFLQGLTTSNTGTGEYINQHIKTTHFDKNAIISSSYAFRKGHFYSADKCIDVIVIGFSAKLLEYQYFEGINAQNIKRIYDFIINEGLIKVSFEDFLNAKIVDTDICIDFFLKDITCREICSIANQLTIISKSIPKSTHYNKKTNVGFEWGKRESIGKAYTTKQYLKYYAKAVELKNNSYEFYQKYVQPFENEEIVFSCGSIYKQNLINEERLFRVETTLKNKDHWKTYELNVDTLNDLLSVDFSKCPIIFNRPINAYMNKYRVIKHRENLTSQEELIIAFIDSISENSEEDKVVITDRFINLIFESKEKTPTNRKSKSVLKKRMFLLIKSKEKTTNRKYSEESINEFKKLGLIPY
jgi:hypothetical protein